MKNRFRILLPLASFAAALTSLPAAAAGKEELVEIDTTPVSYTHLTLPTTTLV